MTGSAASDEVYMRRALELAQRARPIAPPNPAVGAVLVKGGRIIGEGFTQKAGGPHAEVMALRDALSKGNSPEGATAYVTLEPCAHYGRTPPCALALQNAKVARVVAALTDPNPLVAGKGVAMLQKAGIEVLTGVGSREAEEINKGFLRRHRGGLPWVRTKIAMSLDGDTALANGKSQWITSSEARTDGQYWRSVAGAVLTGAGTVRDDDPLLNVRIPEGARQPLKVVVDSNLSLSPQARIFSEGATLLVCVRKDPQRARLFEEKGVEVLEMPGKDGRVDLKELIGELGRRTINEIHVEAGAKLNGALALEGLIDEYILYTAPLLLGPGRPIMDLPALESLSEGIVLEFIETARIGRDLRIIARPQH